MSKISEWATSRIPNLDELSNDRLFIFLMSAEDDTDI
jgi:hypothetical protein